MAKNLAESLNNVLLILDRENTINPEHLEVFEAETDYLKARMGLEPFQAILFAVIVQASSSRHCTFGRIAEELNMSYLELLSYSKDLYALRDRWLIMIKDNNEIKVPSEVVDSLMKDEVYVRPKVNGLSTKAILRRLRGLMDNAKMGQMTPEQLLEETEILIDANPKTSLGKTCIKYLKETGLSPEERIVFYTMVHLDHSTGFPWFDMGDIEEYISDELWQLNIQDAWDANDLELMRRGVIEPAKQEGLISKGSYSIKDAVRKELFSDMVQPDTIFKTVKLNDLSNKPEKEMFYNQREKGQIDRLSRLLSKDSLHTVYESMKAKGLRTGFTCLLYGEPGTGKTETVYQLAKRTGRKILEADVASLRNCYVGETEKNMRNLFEQYRIANKENNLSPILLFNEADAILGKRMEGAVRSVDRMENSVQNILLEEMENFEGIMIATTNLLGNLDPAFERRFLFKIRFNKPELEPRSQIWKSQFPSLNDEEATSLAKEFSFSGGQIENVVRKYTIDSVLSGKEGGYEQLAQYCREESVSKSSRNKIGFYIDSNNGRQSEILRQR